MKGLHIWLDLCAWTMAMTRSPQPTRGSLLLGVKELKEGAVVMAMEEEVVASIPVEGHGGASRAKVALDVGASKGAPRVRG